MAVIILNQKPKKHKGKYVVVEAIKDPKAIEYDARRSMHRMVDMMQGNIEDIINQMRINPDMDPRTIGQQLDALRKQYEFQFDKQADEIAKKWVDTVNRINRERTMDSLRDALGIDVGTIITEDIQEDLNVMMWEAASYIKTIPSELVYSVADRVLQHYKGIPMPENRTLQKQIQEEFKVSKGRAKVIARDQTAKMNTAITAIRQKEVGIDMYVWETKKDERVVGAPNGKWKYNPKNDKHKNHHMMQGKLCQWDDPTVYSDDNGKTWKKRTPEMPKNHPGEDIMCRCRAAPFIDIEKLRVKWAV